MINLLREILMAKEYVIIIYTAVRVYSLIFAAVSIYCNSYIDFILLIRSYNNYKAQ
ncbi:hypothetical protein BDB01DRAFT_769244 [Pilobolus umbonatus]|nr:hypothetical protein BDB01DRAFT_769244 [Pilobolus umbonatus]